MMINSVALPKKIVRRITRSIINMKTDIIGVFLLTPLIGLVTRLLNAFQL
jgi:hypothetical protein